MVKFVRVAVTFFLVTLIASSLVMAMSSKKWLAVTPSSAKPVEIKGKKSSSEYYRLDRKDPLSIKVVGPGSFKVYTRTELSDNQKQTIYGLVVVRDGKKNYLISRSAKVSTVKVVGGMSKIGEQKSVTFKVPKGTHEFKLTLPSDAKNDCYARFAFAEKVVKKTVSKPEKYIPFLPRKFAEEVRIVVKEEEYIYYRTTNNSKVELEIIGPAKLKIISRLEFSNSTQNEKSYRLQFSNETAIVKTSPLKGKISATASYRQPCNLVIGRGETSYLNIPEGKHRYTVSTPDRDSSVLVRFYLPEKALGNEWRSSESDSKAGLNPLKRYILRG